MGNYSEFFKLMEAGDLSSQVAILPINIKQIQKAVATYSGKVKGADDQGRVVITVPTNKGEKDYLVNKAGGIINVPREGINLTKPGNDVSKQLNSFVTELNAPDKEILIEQLQKAYPNATLQGELAQNNGMWLFKDKEGNEFYAKASYDNQGDLKIETYNQKGEKVEASSEKDNQVTTNTLTNIDIQRVGGVIIKYVRSDISKMLLKEMPEAFRQVSVQIIGTGKKKESQIQRKKKLLEAGVTQQPTDLRVVVSFYPNKKGGEVILNADNWNTESAKKYIETAKNDLLVKYSKGIIFKDPTTNTPYQVAISDLNNLEITDENGYQGYFDLAATKVIKAEGTLTKAAKWLFSKSGNLNGSGNKGLASV